MSYKIGLLLSMVFLMSVLLLIGDLTNLALLKNGLDSVALTISYRIAMDGYLSNDCVALAKKYSATVAYEEGEPPNPRIGDTVRFYVSRQYASLILSKEPLTVAVHRTAVVGYYQK